MIDGSTFIFVWLTALLSATKKHALRSDKLSVCSEPTLLHRGDGVFWKWSCRNVPLFLIMFLISWNEHLKCLFLKFLEALRYCLCLFAFVSRARLLRVKIFTFCDSFERVKLMSDPAVNTTGQVFFFLRSQYIDLTAFYNTTLSILVATKSVETGVTTIVLIYRSSSC